MISPRLLARLERVEVRLGPPLEPVFVTLVVVDVSGEVVKEIPFRVGGRGRSEEGAGRASR